MKTIEDVDRILNEDRWNPYHGWHDDHRGLDGTGSYLPAMMQVRDEFHSLIDVIGPNMEGCLQLGMGNCGASHAVWSYLCKFTVTIDLAVCSLSTINSPGLNTHSTEAVAFAKRYPPYNVLFIDAGHEFSDVRQDHEIYGQLVNPGGIIAFHDALPREGYPEVGVPRYIDELRKNGVHVNMIGTEVGIAWIRV